MTSYHTPLCLLPALSTKQKNKLSGPPPPRIVYIPYSIIYTVYFCCVLPALCAFPLDSIYRIRIYRIHTFHSTFTTKKKEDTKVCAALCAFLV